MAGELVGGIDMNEVISLTNDIEFRSGVNTLKGTIFKHNRAATPTVLSLHGAGKANRNRIGYLLERLIQNNMSSFCFDFSGHGESTGRLEQSSLPQRRQEAIAAYEYLDNDKPITVIGSSMGGHIAATLVDQLPIENLILFCPAAYARRAEDVCFDESFSQIIREPRSYLESLAFEKLQSYKGQLLLISGTEDKVIPVEILDNYLERSVKAKRKELLWINGADHQIHPWLQKNDDDLNCVLEKIFDFVKAQSKH